MSPPLTPSRPEPAERDAATVASVAAAVIGAILSLAALGIYGPRTAWSVALGAAIAVANLVTLRAIIRAIIRPPEESELSEPGPEDAADPEKPEAKPARDHAAEGKRGGAAWGVFALLKIFVLFGGIWFLLTRGLVDPIPLVVGYGVLPLGIAASTLFQSLAPRR